METVEALMSPTDWGENTCNHLWSLNGLAERFVGTKCAGTPLSGEPALLHSFRIALSSLMSGPIKDF